jgi:hypothetical protein
MITVKTLTTNQIVFTAGIPNHCDMVLAAYCSHAGINAAHVRFLWETVDEIIPLQYQFKQPIIVRVVSVKEHTVNVYLNKQTLFATLYCPGRALTIQEVLKRINVKNGRLLEMDEVTPVLHRDIKAGESVYVQMQKKPNTSGGGPWLLIFILIITFLYPILRHRI